MPAQAAQTARLAPPVKGAAQTPQMVPSSTQFTIYLVPPWMLFGLFMVSFSLMIANWLVISLRAL